VGDEIIRNDTFGEGGELFPALKVPRQCPLVLPVAVRSRVGKALGSVEGKG
jgi:hypothetical protein